MKLNKEKKQWLTPFIFYLITLLLAINGCGKKEPKKQGEAGPKIQWLHDPNAALALAQEEDKPLMIDFMAEWCPPCWRMEDSTFSHPDVIRKASSFVPLRIDVDKQGKIANKYNGNARKYGGVGIPNVLFMTGDEVKLKHVIGYRGPEEFLAVMDSVLTILITKYSIED